MNTSNPPSHDGANPSADAAPVHPTVPAATSTSSRSKSFATPKLDLPFFSNSQASSQPANGASPVKRKPLPPSASTLPLRPSLSTGGQVVAIGEEDSDETPTLHQPSTSSNKKAPWLSSPAAASPPLLPRDLDQYALLLSFCDRYLFLLLPWECALISHLGFRAVNPLIPTDPPKSCLFRPRLGKGAPPPQHDPFTRDCQVIPYIMTARRAMAE